jgi:hypothetical protein
MYQVSEELFIGQEAYDSNKKRICKGNKLLIYTDPVFTSTLTLLMEISEEWQIGKHYCAGKSFDW